MRVCVVGSGGREHALAEVLATHRRGGGHAGQPRHPGSVATPAEEVDADLYVIGPEAPLVAGLADRLRAAGAPGVRTRAPTAPASRARRSG